jgi:hypothetical protein
MIVTLAVMASWCRDTSFEGREVELLAAFNALDDDTSQAQQHTDARYGELTVRQPAAARLTNTLNRVQYEL